MTRLNAVLRAPLQKLRAGPMWFVGLGVVLIIANLADLGPMGAWGWPGDAWKMLWPFAYALAWWRWSDAMGLTQKHEMDKMDAKRDARRNKALDALGMDHKGRRKHTKK